MSVHRNAQGMVVPSHLWEIACEVEQLFQPVKEQWRTQLDEWVRQQAGDFFPLPSREEGEESPSDEVEYGTERPTAEYSPLPLSLATPEKYAILSAVHDFAADSQTKRIGVYDEEDGKAGVAGCGPEGAAYAVLVVAAGNLPESDTERLVAILDDVRSDLGIALTEAEHESHLRDLVATYDIAESRPDVSDEGIGHVLHCGHDCERVLIRLLESLLTWVDERKLDESAVHSMRRELLAAAEEADGITQSEERVLSHVSGSIFEFLDQHWQSGHECLFCVAKQTAAAIREGECHECLERHFMWTNKENWRRLRAQLTRERTLAESSNEVAYQSLGLIQYVQQLKPREDAPESLDGTFPEGSPRAKRSRASKKGAKTRKANKKKKEEALARAQAAAKLPQEPRPEAKLTRKIYHEKKERTQEETAQIMSERLGYKVDQQWVSIQLKICKTWVEKTGLTVDDIEDLPGGKQRPTSPHVIDKGLQKRSAKQRKLEETLEGAEETGWQKPEAVKPDDSFDGSGYGSASEK